MHENLTLTCFYLHRGVHIAVAFDSQGHAEQITVDGGHHPGIDLWGFLNRLVPAGDHRMGCRYVSHSSGGDTAHACLYHGSLDLIVAYFLHPADPTYGGIVAYDYDGYVDVEQ